MAGFRFRLIDTDGSEIGIVDHGVAHVAVGGTVQLPDGKAAEIVEIYDDEAGRDGDVQATLVVDGDMDGPNDSGREEGRRGLLELLDRFGVDPERRTEIERLLESES